MSIVSGDFIPDSDNESSTNREDTVSKDSTEFSYEFDVPILIGAIKQSADDFQVNEKLKFELTGEGQHLCLFIEKKFLNTQDAIAILSRFFKVHPNAIGYFGLKDKVAVTQQWFSVDLAASKIESDVIQSHCDSFQEAFPELLQQAMQARNKHKTDFPEQKKQPAHMKFLNISRNIKKFKIGQLAGNNFQVVVRNIHELKNNNVSAALSSDLQAQLEKKLVHIKAHGFPNYFGEQRFGRDNQNITLLKRNIDTDLGKRRALRSRIISTYRALVFNRYLSDRLDESLARKYLAGDVLQFNDGKSVFSMREHDSSIIIQDRIDKGEIVVSGPLLGMDASLAKEDSLAFEDKIIRKFRSYSPLLNRYQLKSARRALFARANNLTWYFSANDLFLNFDLDSGSFATSLVREIVNYRPKKEIIKDLKAS
jgi:tRNA pseudouridine13 synthase